MARQGSHCPQGWIVGSVRVPSGPTQLSARATMRAVVVLPTPRTPVSMKAWAMRPVAKALLERPDQGFLADQPGEIGGAVFAGEHAILLGALAGAACRGPGPGHHSACRPLSDPCPTIASRRRGGARQLPASVDKCQEAVRARPRPKADSLRLLPSGPDSGRHAE